MLDKLGLVELLVPLGDQAIRVMLAMLEHLETLELQEILERLELVPQQEMLEEPTLVTQGQSGSLEVVERLWFMLTTLRMPTTDTTMPLVTLGLLISTTTP